MGEGLGEGCGFMYLACLGVRVIDVSPQGVHDVEHAVAKTYVVIHLAAKQAVVLLLLQLCPFPLDRPLGGLARLPGPPTALVVLSQRGDWALGGQRESVVVRHAHAFVELVAHVPFVGEGMALSGTRTHATPVLAVIGEGGWSDHSCGDGGDSYEVCSTRFVQSERFELRSKTS